MERVINCSTKTSKIKPHPSPSISYSEPGTTSSSRNDLTNDDIKPWIQHRNTDLLDLFSAETRIYLIFSSGMDLEPVHIFAVVFPAWKKCFISWLNQIQNQHLLGNNLFTNQQHCDGMKSFLLSAVLMVLDRDNEKSNSSWVHIPWTGFFHARATSSALFR